MQQSVHTQISDWSKDSKFVARCLRGDFCWTLLPLGLGAGPRVQEVRVPTGQAMIFWVSFVVVLHLI